RGSMSVTLRMGSETERRGLPRPAVLFYAVAYPRRSPRHAESRNEGRMDGIFHELSRKTDPAKLLGYLNFSDGRPDPRFQKGLADAGTYFLEIGAPAPWATIPQWLSHELELLVATGSAAFRDPTQARAVIEAALVQLPKAYRTYHADLLAHQPDAALFGPFFLA